MYFDWQLWKMTAGLRGRIALGVILGMLSLCAGIARFVFLGRLLVLVFQGAGLAEVAAPALGVAAAIGLRAALEQARMMIAHRTAIRVQETLRARLFDKLLALGPAWFVTSEMRYVRASGSPGSSFVGFQRIDLSGLTASIGLSARF